MEFKGWVTDYSKSGLQGITDGERTILWNDFEKMAPQHTPKWVDWHQTRKEQGTWLREIMVSMWFKHEANLIVMTDLLEVAKEELDNSASEIDGQRLKARLEVSPQRRP